MPSGDFHVAMLVGFFGFALRLTMLSIQPDDLLKLKEENDELERSIMQHTRKFDVTDDTVPLKEPAPPPKVGGIKVYKFNELPQFTTEAVSDRGTPYMPLQCKKRGHDGTMFTS